MWRSVPVTPALVKGQVYKSPGESDGLHKKTDIEDGALRGEQQQQLTK